MDNNIYKKLYSNEKNSGNLAESPRIKRMFKIIDHANFRGSCILDIGCHDGTFLSMIKNQDNTFFGLDASDWAVTEARKKGLEVYQYFFDDQTPLPFDDNSIDIIVAGEIIEHIYDTDFFLEEIGRTLKAGGKLLISTPNVASFGRRMQLLFGISPAIEISPNETGSVGHIRYFTFKTLKQLLVKHKFKILSEQSDCVNFSQHGKMRSTNLAQIFPTFGASVIMLVKKL